MPDPTIQILSTRPLSPELIMGAAEKGISIDVIPFIRTEAVENVDLRQRVEVLGRQKLVAVFTSANAVEVVAEWTGAKQSAGGGAPLAGDGRQVASGGSDWTIFCIGAATRQLVSRHFGEGAIADTAESALALAKKIVDRRGAGDIFFFCGDLRREELPTTLREAGFRVNELVVYRTKATPSVVKLRYRGVIFFSPSAVESYFSMNGVKDETVMFAIGGTTAATIKRFCDNTVVVSEQPDAAILIRQVIEYFQIKQ
ncbi:MAG TPA: uroporphyrinogen-III synthase [Puia sp.]|nr:uroporphyrinogen-III synthase [Puia sp.]